MSERYEVVTDRMKGRDMFPMLMKVEGKVEAP